MKLQLVVEANGANLNIVAESQFEIDTLKRCHESFSEMSVWLRVDEGNYDRAPARGATMQILMKEGDKKPPL